MEKVSPFLSTQVSSLLTTDPQRRPTAEEMLIRLNEERNKVVGSAPTPLEDSQGPPKEQEPPFLLVHSKGPAADHQSSMLGLYRKSEKLGFIYIQESDTKFRAKPSKLFAVKGVWKITPDVLTRLRASSPSKNPTSVNWQYLEYGAWRDDPALKVVGLSDKPISCEQVTISLGEGIKRDIKEPGVEGVYIATGLYKLGRPVLQQVGGRFSLYIGWSWEGGCWEVSSVVGGAEYLVSGSAPDMCPADPRARRNEWRDQTYWKYKDKRGVLKESRIINVVCKTHSR